MTSSAQLGARVSGGGVPISGRRAQLLGEQRKRQQCWRPKAARLFIQRQPRRHRRIRGYTNNRSAVADNRVTKYRIAV